VFNKRKVGTASIDSEGEITSVVAIQPNPVNNIGHWLIRLPQGATEGRLSVISMHGQVMHEERVAGTGWQDIVFSAEKLGLKSGMYFIQLHAAGTIQTQRMLVR